MMTKCSLVSLTPPSFPPIPFQQQLRVSFYMRMKAVEDIETQKQGFINIISSNDLDGLFDFDLSGWKNSVSKTANLNNALPGRVIALHVCFSNLNTFTAYFFSSIIQFMVLAVNRALKARIRIHKGKYSVCCVLWLCAVCLFVECFTNLIV